MRRQGRRNWKKHMGRGIVGGIPGDHRIIEWFGLEDNLKII